MSEPPVTVSTEERPKMSVRGAIFLGVGGMVGAGIFALLGQAGAIAGSAVWISFLVAGTISAALGYTLVKLGVRFPSSGGIITYLVEGFGNGRTVGIAAWLGYFTAIVAVAAMVAVSFGDYAASALVGADPGTGWSKLFGSLIVLAAAWLTTTGARWVDRSQSVIVIALLAAFGVFIVATLKDLDLGLLSASTYPSVRSIVSSVALTFFAFLGFAVISFAAGDLRRPERALPRAMYGALAITTALYVTIALGVFGTLTVPEVVHYGPTALAEAARPSLGDAGYAMMTVAALLATSSSVLATFYASAGFTSTLADVGQFPPIFGRESRFGRNGGLVTTAAVTLVCVNLFSLGAIASVGSAVSLAVFILVGIAGLRLRREIHASTVVVLAAIGAAGVVLVVFAIDTLRADPGTFWTMIGVVALAVGIDTVWRRVRKPPAATPVPRTSF